VVAADDPDRAVVLEDAVRFLEPGAGEAVVRGEGVELVPIVGDRVDMRAVGTEQLAAQLQVIGGVCEDHVDRLGGERLHRRDAVSAQDLVERQHRRLVRGGDPRPRDFDHTHVLAPNIGCIPSESGDSVKRTLVKPL
jgi:hypothetical protein